MSEKAVRELMQIGVPVCKIDTPLVEVARLLSEEERDILVVMGEKCVEGVLTQSDMARAFLDDYYALTAQDIMTPSMSSVPPDIPVTEAVRLMIERGFHQMLVVPADQEPAVPVGVLSKRHVVELMAEQQG
jgi:CBS domain-containing protein